METILLILFGIIAQWVIFVIARKVVNRNVTFPLQVGQSVMIAPHRYLRVLHRYELQPGQRIYKVVVTIYVDGGTWMGPMGFDEEKTMTEEEIKALI